MEEGSGLTCTINSLFRTSSETFPKEKMVSREPSLNPVSCIVNQNLAEVDRAGLDAGKVRFSFTQELFIEEFKRK